ncbi:MAG TPA: type II restriction endonuclease, partial [Gemmatimonadales bacterium]|nr:type II restriction endonuclease [Gemmatimonadales bacterium]
DLGAVAGLLFDLGTERYVPPPRPGDDAARQAWEADLARVRRDSAATERMLAEARDGDRTHTEVQGWLRDLGRALGFSVWVAANDQGRPCGEGRLGDGCLDALPAPLARGPGADAVRLIDVIWINPADERVAAAFEVEHTTSIYSGIVRLLDLALGGSADASRGLYLVAPDRREADVRAQLARPAFSRVSELQVRFLPYGELERHRHAMARFGQGMKAIESVARSLS